MVFRRSSSSIGRRRLRLYYASDIHGSEKCWRKFVRAASFYKADVLIFGGDFSGKVLVPIARRADGTYEATWIGSHYVLKNAEELPELEKRIRFNGFYPYVCDPDEVTALAADPVKVDATFRAQVVASVAAWLELAERELATSTVECIVIPGNDDDWALDPVLSRSHRVLNGDRRVLPVADGEYQVVSLGVSNRTPWDSPRELDEPELAAALKSLESEIHADRITIANLHVPPYGSRLDDAPALTDDLHLVSAAGERPTVPVGSHAVREWIERLQPVVSLHGHIHESRGATNIGRTLSVNPGSRYNEGVLLGVIVELEGDRVLKHQFVSG
jgi:Icc-related predicted phosphoesterase